MRLDASLFILGSGEIARCLAGLAATAGYKTGVCDTSVHQWEWPDAVTLHAKQYIDQPWKLPAGTHAIIARGHDGDAESIACLLNQGADRVYLIASARRAQSVIEEASSNIQNPELLKTISTSRSEPGR